MPELLYTYVMKQVVVLGGGVAGLRATIALSKKLPKNSVTLVDKEQNHVLPFAPWIVREQGQALQHTQAVAFDTLAERFGFAHVRGAAQRIDVRNQVVRLVDRYVPYDFLVMALGSSPALQFEHALSIAQLQHLHTRLQFAFQRQQRTPGAPLTVAVVGGSMTGVAAVAQLSVLVHETAGMYSMPAERVRIVCFEQQGRLLPAYRYEIARTVERYVHGLRVEVRCHTPIAHVEQSYVRTQDGTEIPAHITVWAAGWRAQEVGVEGGALPLGSRSQILVNKKFQTHSFPNIFCIGDLASPPLPHRHGAVQETLAEAEYVAAILPQIMQNMHVPAYSPVHRAEYIPLHQGNVLRLQESSATTGLLARLGLRRAEQKYKKLLGV